MLLPSADQYSVIVAQNDLNTLSVLTDYTFLHDDVEKTTGRPGSNAVIFKAVKDGKTFAARFFSRGDQASFKRYEEVARYLRGRDLPWKISFEVLDKELFFEGERYPVLLMEWIEAINLNQYINRIYNNPVKLAMLQESLVHLSRNLEQNGIGHGDLNYSHVLIVNEATKPEIRLADYDSVYIPAFKGQNSMEAGSPGFQHPRRMATDFSETIDRFSIWIMLAALEAIRQNAQLWNQAKQIGYNRDTNLLFNLKDLIQPGQSKLFQQLHSIRSEALEFYLKKLEAFCQDRDLNGIEPPQLYNKEVVEQQPAITQAIPVTPVSVQEEQLYDIEIRSNPPGKEVLVHGKKRGITPLRLALSEKDFHSVELVNGSERTSLVIRQEAGIYQVDFTRKRKTVVKEENEESFAAPGNQITGKDKPVASKRNYTKTIVFVFILLVIGAGSYFIPDLLSDSKDKKMILRDMSAAKGMAPLKPVFNQEELTRFLAGLYDSYNKRDLSSIMNHYAPRVREYYDSKNLAKDSLQHIIKNLFIAPQYYQCFPDYTSIHIVPSGNECTMDITIRETIKPDSLSRMQTYSTSIVYRVDSNFQVISEKALNKE